MALCLLHGSSGSHATQVWGFSAFAKEQGHDGHLRGPSLAKRELKIGPVFGPQWCNEPCHTLQFQSPPEWKGEVNASTQLRGWLVQSLHQPKHSSSVFAETLAGVRVVMCWDTNLSP